MSRLRSNFGILGILMRFERLGQLAELDLIRQILMPLFEKMSFKAVDFYHEGVSELDGTGTRINWAVVVRSGEIMRGPLAPTVLVWWLLRFNNALGNRSRIR